jgi:hypothetical protein
MWLSMNSLWLAENKKQKTKNNKKKTTWDLKAKTSNRHLWLTPVILATQEDRNLKPALANSSETLSQKKKTKKTQRRKGLAA